MEAWVSNSIWISAVIALVCWWVTGLFWFQRLHFALRVPVALAATFCAMTIVGASASFLVHAISGQPNLIAIVIDAPRDAAAYFSETGWETGVLWLPTMVLRVFFLSFAAWRKRHRKEERHV